MKSLLDYLVVSRIDDVLDLVDKDERVAIEKEKHFKNLDEIEKITGYQTRDKLECQMTLLSGYEIESAYRIGLADGFKLLLELIEASEHNQFLIQLMQERKK
jgi:hypothetical protein